MACRPVGWLEAGRPTVGQSTDWRPVGRLRGSPRLETTLAAVFGGVEPMVVPANRGQRTFDYVIYRSGRHRGDP